MSNTGERIVAEGRGLAVVISAASGTGKTSLCRALLKTVSNLASSVSYTTRAPRGEELDGREYHFVDEATFDRMIAEGEFVEWAQVFGNRYGTAFQTVERQMDHGVDVLLDIDVQGGHQIRRRIPDALLVFLLPPSMDELRRRLVNRAEDTPAAIERRLAEAQRELRHASTYDYLVINDDFDEAAAALRAILRTERLRRNPPLRHLEQLLRT